MATSYRQRPRSRVPSNPRPPNFPRDVLIRRAVASGAFILVLVLLLYGVRGCLDARKERGFENYVSDLSSLGAESQTISERFFTRLAEPDDLTPLQLEAEIKADRSAMDALLQRAENLDAPGELGEAQDLVILAYQLRRDGLAGISESVALALGDAEAKAGANAIADDMRTLLTSDVIYARARAGIETELTTQEITVPEGTTLATQFLPDEPNWLDPSQITKSLSGFADTTEGARPA